jgi:hypothetical protein
MVHAQEQTMPSLKDLWPDKWLRAEHLQGKRPTVAIDAVTVEELYNPRSKKHEAKLIVQFYGKSLRLVLNKTQAHALASICGTDDYSAWVGHRVVLSTGRAPNGADTISISPVPDVAPAA